MAFRFYIYTNFRICFTRGIYKKGKFNKYLVGELVEEFDIIKFLNLYSGYLLILRK